MSQVHYIAKNIRNSNPEAWTVSKPLFHNLVVSYTSLVAPVQMDWKHVLAVKLYLQSVGKLHK